MSYNKDELVPPQWMDQGFFEKALQSYENDKELKINHLKIIPGTQVGDHFASIMFRVNVNYARKKKITNEIDLIIKALPEEEGLKKKLIGSSPIFEVESRMYVSVLPEIERLLKRAGYEKPISPKLVYISQAPVAVILEDVSKYGWKMNYTPLNYESSVLVLKELAHFHAASFSMKKETPEVTKFSCGLFNDQGLDAMDMMSAGLLELAKEVRTWSGFEIYADKIEAMHPKFDSLGKAVFKPNEPGKGYNVLNHGDFHIRNMLFKYINDKIVDVLLLDFQISVWASPAIDLIYAFYTLIDHGVRESRRDELVVCYYEEFVRVLDDLGYMERVPTLVDLHIELLKCGFLEVVIALCFLPVMISLENNKVTDMEDIFNSSKNVMFKAPRYKDLLQKLLPTYSFKGFI